MEPKSQSKRQRELRRTARLSERGATSVHILVILVPVLFGFMGFAIDLGRLYLVRGELKTAANAMAVAAAQKLIGTESSTTEAGSAARLAINNAGGFANKYDFGGIVIGEGSGQLASQVSDPAYYETRAAAVGEGEGGAEATGSTAKHARISIDGEAPLIFWSFLSLGQERKTRIAALAVAGVSAPLCTACGIQPMVIAAPDSSDTTNYGLTVNTRYTLGYQCSGGPPPSGLAGAVQRLPYLLIDRYNEEATLFPDESSQLFRTGAGGLPSHTNSALACITIGTEEEIWASAAPAPCNQNRIPASATNFVCGLASRFDPVPAAACVAVAEVDTIASAYQADTDIADVDDYTAYTGNTRRVITIGIVETLQPTGTMAILGFRQFLIEPNANDTTISPSDTNGRFAALYIGSAMPLRSGSFGGCTQQTAGPGKVVLHR